MLIYSKIFAGLWESLHVKKSPWQKTNSKSKQKLNYTPKLKIKKAKRKMAKESRKINRK
jgi:uncharacterized protein YfaT (DUF1175 family)